MPQQKRRGLSEMCMSTCSLLHTPATSSACSRWVFEWTPCMHADQHSRCTFMLSYPHAAKCM